MPSDLPNEQELALKKRARRRLVGAIALVLLMIIILPQVLQDRALLAQQEPIRIVMPEAEKTTSEAADSHSAVEVPADAESVRDDLAANGAANSFSADEIAPDSEAAPAAKAGNQLSKEADAEKDNNEIAVPAEKKEPLKTAATSKPEAKAPFKSESFTVQVGVYSNAANVKRLQDQLKQAGFTTHTEKVATSGGESLRLKAGSFSSRQDAVAALAKIKAMNLPGIVVGNE